MDGTHSGGFLEACPIVLVGVATLSEVTNITKFFFMIHRYIGASFHINNSVKLRFSKAEDGPHSKPGHPSPPLCPSTSAISWTYFLLLLWQFLLAGWFCWQAGDATCPGIYLFLGRPPTMLVTWPPIGIDCVFLLAGAFHFLTYRLEKFLLFPLVRVVK